MLKIFGILILLLPFIPLARLFDGLPGVIEPVPPMIWVYGTLIFAVPALVLAQIYKEIPAVQQKIEAFIENRSWTLTFLGLAALPFFIYWVSKEAFSNQPVLVDSVVQYIQAKIFASGSLTIPNLMPTEFVVVQHILLEGERLYTQYAPGHGALLSLWMNLGIPELFPACVSALVAVFVIRISNFAFGKTAALLSVLLLFCSPFFFLMGASFMNHVSACLGIAACTFYYLKWGEDLKKRNALLAGLFLGLAFLVRPLTSIAIGSAFALSGLLDKKKREDFGGIALGIVCFVGVASLYLLYNKATTGAYFEFGYTRLWGESHGLGFHEDPWGRQHTFLRGAKQQLINVFLLNEFLFSWPIPALFPLGLFLVSKSDKLTEVERTLLLAFIAAPCAHIFYWHSDPYLGPRFLYETIVFLIPLSARAFCYFGSMKESPLPFLKSEGLGGKFLACSAVALLLLFSFAYSIRERVEIASSSLPTAKVNPVKEAISQGIEKGLIFTKVSWGNRLLAGLRGYGLSASDGEIAYIKLGHCLLQQTFDEAKARKLSVLELSEQLTEMIKDERNHGEKVLVETDRSLKLRKNIPLASRCREELRYDRPRSGLYTNPFASNEVESFALNPDARWIVARDMRGENEKLIELIPEMPAYLYANGEFTRLN